MIDTHTHIYLEEFDEDRAEVVRRAREAGVERVILPNVDLDTVAAMQATHDLYPGYCRMAMGLHPTSVDADYRERLDQTHRLLLAGDYCAVGEIGLDLYWDKTFAREQEEAFVVQTGWAVELDLPVIIHCRDAFAEMVALLQSGRVPSFRGVFHSFTGTADEVRTLRTLGDYYFGINGIVTFKNAHLEEMVREVGIDRLLLETDAPYLAPVPYRGKRNEPSYLPRMAQRIADILGVTLAEVESATMANAFRLFGEW
ncbi:TatD family hydrolase [uncultured Barnesiella sp.]|uniref:TatD family hydrolase n=1 Tax=uncultured Barnesiella sp. TaxID=584861 RepID=UPI0026343A20|nr:TatD family hydrolase [uncultured Barnesiella sp.]